MTEQNRVWNEKICEEYTERNYMSVKKLETIYKTRLGFTRTEINLDFIGAMDRSIRILEVGCNIGNQLLCLQAMGFQQLYGIDIQRKAVKLAKQRTSGIRIIQGDGIKLPFRDGFFDLVFTSSLLIHFSPSDIKCVMREIYRCTKRYVWGYEYYADNYTEINWRGQRNLMWKANFVQIYLRLFADLYLIKERKFCYLNGHEIDSMFLLEKKKAPTE